MAVTGVIDTVAVEVYHVVDAAGEEAVTWLRFAGSTSRIGLGVLLVGLTAMSFFAVWVWTMGDPEEVYVGLAIALRPGRARGRRQ